MSDDRKCTRCGGAVNVMAFADDGFCSVDCKKARQRAYIAGPMRGKPEHNFPEFYAAEHLLVETGWDVHNPARWDEEVCGFDRARSVAEQMFDVAAALRQDLTVVATWADAVFVLPDWQDSVGARLEVAVAQASGVPVFTMAGDRVDVDVTTAVA